MNQGCEIKSEKVLSIQQQKQNDHCQSSKNQNQQSKQNKQNLHAQNSQKQQKQQNCPLQKQIKQNQPSKQNNSDDQLIKKYDQIKDVKSSKQKYEFCDGSIIFSIDQHYEIRKLVGSGIYGVVASGYNKQTKQQVAIKKIPKLFNNFGDTKRVLRQIKVLEFLNNKNIISLNDIMKIEDPQHFNEIYLCMEYMEFDLRRLILSSTKITEPMVKHIMYQLLVAINFMHSADILHRDLKPQNILMNKKCDLKLADMNLARKQTYTGNITEYVASRPYRAPQILIGSTVYTKSVDIWSIGCVFAELLGKTIIFQGKDFIDQLKRFVAILGKPKIQYFPHIDKTSKESLAKLIAEIPDKKKVQWKYLMSTISDKAADLLDHMLTYDASARFTAQQCLNHPYLEQYKKAPKVKCNEIFDFSFDRIELNQKSLRNAICQAVDQFNTRKTKNGHNEKQFFLQDKSKKKIKPNQ